MNPTVIEFVLPSTNTDGTQLAISDIWQVNVGIGTKSGEYSIIAHDATFAPGADGKSHELIVDAFGVLKPGKYFLAAQTENKAGKVSAWSDEAQFTIEDPIPNPPTGVTVS
jgi:hypothetical protein